MITGDLPQLPTTVAPLFSTDGDLHAALAMAEVHHRIANTLSFLAASLRLDSATFKDPGLRALLRRHEHRIVQFGKLHRHLSTSCGNESISTEAYFKALGESLIGAILAPNGVQCEIFICDGLLSTKKCESAGLIITELVTNAAKPAFCNMGAAMVRIEIIKEGKFWRCSVTDNGHGVRTGSSGTGSKILRTIAQSLNGLLQVRFNSSGTAVSVTFPAD
jgi:two-component sensor histidine kinase